MSGDRYQIIISELKPYNMSDKITLTICEKGSEVAIGGNYLEYSIENYAYNQVVQGKGTATLQAMCNAMMNYGNAVKAYIGK